MIDQGLSPLSAGVDTAAQQVKDQASTTRLGWGGRRGSARPNRLSCPGRQGRAPVFPGGAWRGRHPLSRARRHRRFGATWSCVLARLCPTRASPTDFVFSTSVRRRPAASRRPAGRRTLAPLPSAPHVVTAGTASGDHPETLIAPMTSRSHGIHARGARRLRTTAMPCMRLRRAKGSAPSTMPRSASVISSPAISCQHPVRHPRERRESPR
jgi:hypothetical protein